MPRFLFLSLVAVYFAAGKDCNIYSCAPSNVTIPSGDCIRQIGDNYYLKPCVNQTCDTSSGSCVPKQNTTQKAYPGEFCTSNSTCKYGTCVKFGKKYKCQGKDQGEDCSVHEECNPGLMCAANDTCQPQIAIGKSGCRDKYDCVNNAQCNFTRGVSDGLCVELMSGGIGERVSDCVASSSQVCSSGVCEATGIFGSFGVCIKPFRSKVSNPNMCTDDTQCIGTNGKDDVIGTCRCGYNEQGFAYCEAFPGDFEGTNYLSTWYYALEDSQGECNTKRRDKTGCLEVIDWVEEVTQATFMFENYPWIVNNDYCVKQIYTNEYWSSALQSCLAALALIAIYF